MSKSKNAVWSWCSDPDAPPQFRNEASRRLELANLTKENEDDRVFAYQSVNGGVKTVTLTRNEMKNMLKMVEGCEDTTERQATLIRYLLTAKYMDQLLEKKASLQQKGLRDEEIKTTLERFYPEPEHLAILDPSRVDEFVRMAVEGGP